MRIREPKQPLLVSLPRKSEQRGDKDKDKGKREQGPVLLVPELCALVGTVLDEA